MNVEITSNRWTCVSRMSVEQESMTKNIDRHVWHSTRTKTDNMRREDSSTPVETFKRVERSMAVAPAKQIPKDATKLVGWRAQSRRCDDNSRPRASFTGPFTQRALTAQTCSHQETARFVGNYVVEPRGKSTDQGSNPCPMLLAMTAHFCLHQAQQGTRFDIQGFHLHDRHQRDGPEAMGRRRWLDPCRVKIYLLRHSDQCERSCQQGLRRWLDKLRSPSRGCCRTDRP